MKCCSKNPEALAALASSFSAGVRQGGRGVMQDADIYLQPWNLPLDRIARPIRYWHGGADRHISAGMARSFVSTIPHARLDVDPDEGHFSLAIRRARSAMDHCKKAQTFHCKKAQTFYTKYNLAPDFFIGNPRSAPQP